MRRASGHGIKSALTFVDGGDMHPLRQILSDILIACAITIIVVVLALIVPLVVWLRPDRQETSDGSY